MDSRSHPIRGAARRTLRATGRVLAAGAVACAAAAAGAEGFDDPMDILHAMEDGTFVERAGLTEELEALRTRTPPPPVKIEFVSGQAVPAGAMPELRKLADALEGDETIVLDLVGCSDPSGPAALNQRISQGRAESVAAALEDLGVSRDRFREVVGRGESCEVQERAVHVTPVRPEAARPGGEDETS